MSSFLRTASIAARPSIAAARAFSTTPARPFARITVVGHLADAPELSATSTGREIVRYVVASNSGPRDNRHVSWFRVTSFEREGPRRDFLQNLAKGSMVYVEGDATLNAFEDSQGQKRTTLNIVQRSIEILKRPYTDESSGSESGKGSQ